MLHSVGRQLRAAPTGHFTPPLRASLPPHPTYPTYPQLGLPALLNAHGGAARGHPAHDHPQELRVRERVGGQAGLIILQLPLPRTVVPHLPACLCAHPLTLLCLLPPLPCSCTHFIIGRDMAGCKSSLTGDDFYGGWEQGVAARVSGAVLRGGGGLRGSWHAILLTLRPAPPPLPSCPRRVRRPRLCQGARGGAGHEDGALAQRGLH